jgi:3-oxoadipate enol-lactonase
VTVELYHRLDGAPIAPPLLMGGSLGTDSGMWDGQLPLATSLRLVRFDYRGHGGTPATPGPYSVADLAGDVLALMDSLDLARASYCGLSIGGMIGMWLGANAPDRVERLVVICTAARMPNGDAFIERAAAVRGEQSTESVADGVVARWLTPEFAEAHPDVRGRLRSMITDTDPEGYAGCCEAVGNFDIRGQLNDIRAPTLVISGAQDLATPVELQDQIVAGIPKARHEVLSPGAHLTAVEQARRVNDLIGEHVL